MQSYLVAITFLVVLAVVFGAYWLIVGLPEENEQAALQRRLRTDDPKRAKARVRLLKEAESLSNIAALDRTLQTAGAVMVPLHRFLASSGLPITVGAFVLMSAVSFFATALIVSFYIPFWWAIWPVAAAAIFIPYGAISFMRGRRVRKFEEQFPEAIELIARALRAGHAFATGIKLASEELPEPAGPEFKLLYDLQNFGAQMPDALRSFAERVPTIDARFFVTAVLTQREAGGNLSEILDRLAAVMRERFKIRQEVRTRSAHGRITAYILAFMPPALAVMLLMLNPAQMQLLATDPLGIRFIIAGVVLQVAGVLIVRKLIDIQVLSLAMDFTQLALIGVFASVALVAGAVTSMILSRGNVERRRLRQVVSSPSSVLPVLPELLPLASEGPGGTWEDLERLLLHRSRKEMNRLRLRMTRAGIQSPGAPALYTIAEVVLPVVLGGGAYLYAPLSPPLWYILIVAAVAGGFFLPGFWLESRLSKRRREIQNGLPDALDLMVVCIEAGSGLDQAILKTAEEIYFAYPALGDELRILNSEIRAGKTRIEAFKSLAQRTKVDDIRALTAMLVQTDRFGTSIGQALRTHADNSRTRRRQRAEEAAQKIGVKLVFPLVFCFFPAFYVVVLGPAVIMFVRNFQ